MKSLGIFLYAPAFIFIFPEIPQWVAKIFRRTITDYEKRLMGRQCHRVYILIGLTLILIGAARVLARRALDADA